LERAGSAWVDFVALIVSLGSYLYVIDQVPENTSNSVRISGPGSGFGIEGARDLMCPPESWMPKRLTPRINTPTPAVAGLHKALRRDRPPPGICRTLRGWTLDNLISMAG